MAREVLARAPIRGSSSNNAYGGLWLKVPSQVLQNNHQLSERFSSIHEQSGPLALKLNQQAARFGRATTQSREMSSVARQDASACDSRETARQDGAGSEMRVKRTTATIKRHQGRQVCCLTSQAAEPQGSYQTFARSCTARVARLNLSVELQACYASTIKPCFACLTACIPCSGWSALRGLRLPGIYGGVYGGFPFARILTMHLPVCEFGAFPSSPLHPLGMVPALPSLNYKPS